MQCTPIEVYITSSLRMYGWVRVRVRVRVTVSGVPCKAATAARRQFWGKSSFMRLIVGGWGVGGGVYGCNSCSAQGLF